MNFGRLSTNVDLDLPPASCNTGQLALLGENPATAICFRDATQKKYGIFWEFSQRGGGGLLKSQNFCKLTKLFLVCQNLSEVPKHVLQ